MTTSITRPDNKNKAAGAALKIAAIVFWTLIWQLAAMHLDSLLLLPSPVQTLQRLYELAATTEFWLAAGYSMARIVLGCASGIALGTLLGAATAFSRVLHSLFSPVLTVVRATPVASFIILALVWIRRDNMGIFISFLMVLPVMWANVSQGVAQCDRELLEMARVFQFSAFKRIRKIYVPCAAPYFFAGCTTSVGLAWKAGVAAEVLSLPKHAIGSELYYSKIYLETPSLFAVTLVVIIMSLLLERLLSLALKRFAGWQK